MRDFGAIQSPQNAFYLNFGLESLHLHMAQHCKNGLAMVEHFAAHPKIAWVCYPSLEGDEYFERAQKYLPNGSCGVGGGRSAVEMFMKNRNFARRWKRCHSCFPMQEHY